MRVASLLALCLLTSCGRYSSFTLPIVQREPAAGTWVWEPVQAPVLARGNLGEWDAVDALNPSVLHRTDGYWNYYSGFDGRTWHTGLAVSSDGVAWRKSGRVLSPQGWEGAYIAANGAALDTGREILYWYQAAQPPQIAMARSVDGKTFTRHPTPVLTTGPRRSWEERGVADPYVVRFGGFFYLYYLGQDRARRQRLGLARSSDGIHWTRLRSNPILELGEAGSFDENGLGEPAVWFSNGSYWMLYTGRDRNEFRRMGLARSQDGVRWSKLASPVIAGVEAWNSKVVCDATVEPSPDGIHVWYGGGDEARPDERLNGQIGYGVLRWR